MTNASANKPLLWYARLVALATLGLVCMGGLVTSKGVGMAVPDWPTSFGYNMFALPISTWMTGGVFDEHTHRIWASTVGLLVVALTRWAGGSGTRKWLGIIGAAEILIGVALMSLGPSWKGEAHFLLGIGGVVLAGALVWLKNLPAPATTVRLAWAAFWLVQFQGALGGLRVVLDKWVVVGTTGGMLFGICHGCLGQLFFVLVTALAISLSPWRGGWSRFVSQIPGGGIVYAATGLVFCQLFLGLLMRHQHAGLAIPDLPLAYGQIWPATDAESLARYVSRREGIDAVTPFQIHIHMLHRLNAVLTFAAVIWSFVWTRRLIAGHPLRAVAMTWLILLTAQFTLGVFTVLTNKSADIATAHVALGAISLATGVIGSWINSATGSAKTAAGTQPILAGMSPAGAAR